MFYKARVVSMRDTLAFKSGARYVNVLKLNRVLAYNLLLTLKDIALSTLIKFFLIYSNVGFKKNLK